MPATVRLTVLKCLLAVMAMMTSATAVAADLQLTDYTSTPEPVANGADATFSIRVTNNGPGSVANPVVTIAVSDRFEVIDAAGNFPSYCSVAGAVGNQTLTCALPALATGPANSQTFSYTARARAIGSSNTTASIAASGNSDGNSGNNALTITPTVRAGADLSVTKTASAASVPAGALLNYTLTARNTGPNDSGAIRVVDNLPPAGDYQFTGASGTGWTCGQSGLQVTCDYSGAAQQGAYPAITITGRVTKATAGTITNNAFAQSRDAQILDPNAGNDAAAPVVTTITDGSDLAAVKTMSPSTIIVGDAATITLSIRNDGPQSVPAGTRIVDTIASNLTIGAMPAGCTRAVRTVTCTAGALGVAGQANFVIPVTGATPTASTQTNSAALTPPTGFTDADPSNNSATATFDVVPANADLEIASKDKGPNPVAPGAAITSTITVRNLGPSIANYAPGTPIRVTDQLSADETWNGVSPNGWACTAPSTIVTCETTGTGTLAVGATLVLPLVTTSPVGTDTGITNTACTDRTGGSGHLPSAANSPTANDCRTAGTRSTTETADLRIIKQVSLSPSGPWTSTPALAVANSTQSFYVRLQVSNLSGNTARTVTVRDTMPNYIADGSLVTGFTTTSATGGTVSYTGATIGWALTNLAVGQTETAIIEVTRPFESGAVTNTASVFSPDTTETDVSNNTSSADINAAAAADMTVSGKSISPDPARVGVGATYTINVRNAGANPADAVVLEDVIDPARFEILGTPTTTKPGGSCTVDAGTGTVSCTLGSFIRNEVRQVSVDVRARYPFGSVVLGGFAAPHTNRATVQTSTLDTNGGTSRTAGNNFFDLTHSVDAPSFDLAVTKVETNPATDDPVRFDETLNYDVRVSNFGPSRATNVVVTDLPQPPAGTTMTLQSVVINPAAADSGLQLQAAPNAGCTAAGATLLCKIDQGNAAANFLDSGRQVMFRMVYVMGGTTPSTITTFINEVQVTSAEQPVYNGAGADYNTGNNNRVQTTTVLPSTDFEVVSKTRVTASPANINQPVEYLIRVRNNGPSSATQMRVTDTLPAGFVFDTATAPTATPVGGSATVSAVNCSGTSAILCIIDGSFPAGAANILDLRVFARAALPYTGLLAPAASVNTAAIEPGRDANGDPLSEDSNGTNNSQQASVLIQNASIAGTVYADNDRSDSFSGGEALPNVFVRLTGTDINGTAIDVTVQTNGSGAYLFDRLSPSNAAGYTITETQPGGYFDRNETAGTSGGTIDNSAYGNADAQNRITGIILAAATNATGYIFQEVEQASLSGTIYRDLNNNGTRDGGEAGYGPTDFATTPQLRLTGTDYAGNPVDLTATVNTLGFYEFAGLAPSDLVTGYTVTELVQPTGASDGLDTNGVGAVVAGSRGRTAPEAIVVGIVAPAAALTERNFGELPSSSLAGVVFFDPNTNAIKDGSETVGLAGAIITLGGTDDLGATVNCAITTDATGAFSFPGGTGTGCAVLRPGTYTLTETPPPGLQHTGAFIGTVGGTVGATSGINTAAPGAANFGITNIVITAGTNATGYAFGETGQGLSGSVYVDGNNSGVRDIGERGIPGVTVTLSGTTSTGQDVCTIITCTVTTNAAGNYSFLNLPGSNAAGYTITEAAQTTAPLSAFTDGTDAVGGLSGTPRGNAGNDVFTGVTIGAGELLTRYDFGERGASLAGTVYIDTNNDGSQAGTEPGIGGVAVTLSGTTGFGTDICTYLAGLSPPRSCNATTGTDGSYSFADLPAGTYTLVEAQPSAFADGRETAGTSGGTVNNSAFGPAVAQNRIAAITLAAGTASTGNLFGELGVAITGYVFKDPERDGTDAGSEPRLAGVIIRLKDVNNLVIATATTGTDGSFTFTNLAAGTYTIEEEQPAGYGSSTPNSVQVTVSAGGAQAVRFGETVSTIAGNVFVDGSNDGIRQSPAERGIPAATITLTGTDAAGTAVNRTATTAADGSYKFDDLLAGTYTLTETQPASFADGNDTAGSAGGTAGNDTISAITLPIAADAAAYDFGERGQGLTGVVYDDRNRNGSFAAGDAPIAGVTITLSGRTSSGVDICTLITCVVTTDANGRYSYPDIEAGSYELIETQPPGYGDAADNGSNRRSFTVTAGTAVPDVNFGETTGSLAGAVYNDSNGNGLRDPNEPAIPGVTVTLTGTDARGNAVTQTAVTGADGSYRFIDLPGGSYVVTETQPAAFADGTDRPGSAGGTAANDSFAVTLPAATDATGYLFGEQGALGQISGTVWFDRNHDRVRDANEEVKPGWTVQLLIGTTLVSSTTTDANGRYNFTGIAPGTGYALRFVSPDNIVFSGARTNEDNGAANPGTARIVNGEISDITLVPGGSVPNQSLPLDPSGIVYDSVRRVPVPGARVTIAGPAGFDPAVHLLGGAANATQTVGNDGAYQYLLIPGAPAGTYTLAVTPPNGSYNPTQPSTIIAPCPGPLNVAPSANPLLVSLIDGAPANGTAQDCATGTASTAYFLTLTINPNQPGRSADVVNNNIPIDPVLKGAIVVTKTTPLVNVTRGQLVPYTITARNTLAGALTGITISDRVPAGFQYRTGSARVNGVAAEPLQVGRVLNWRDQNFRATEERRIDLILVVGAGVREGEHVNQAYAVNEAVATVVSDIAEATVRIVPDPDFDCSDILGKVFDDRNVNGMQDEGEPGLPGVRLATVNGLLVTTDQFGRYHITCPMIPREDRGSNFILKVDTRTLPTGYRMTTGNPETVRMTRGHFTTLNFGAAIHRVVRLDVTAAMFDGDAVRADFAGRIAALATTLADQPSVLRIAYAHGAADAADDRAIARRIDALEAAIRRCWGEDADRYRLTIETEVTTIDASAPGDVQ